MQLIAAILSAVGDARDGSMRRRAEAVFFGATGEDLQRKHVAAFLLAVAFMVYFLSPLYTALTTAFKTKTGVLTTLPLSLPGKHFTVETWLAAWDVIAPSLINSLLMTIPAMFFSAVLGSFAAYGLTMVDWRGQVAMVVLFTMALFLPRQAILVPLSQFWRFIDLEAMLGGVLASRYITLIELIITHTCYGISICTVLFRGYYLTIGQDIIEAARVDGANIFSIYRNIILPLSYPMFMVVFIFQFTQIYNEFFYALILVGGTDASLGAPAPLALQALNSARQVSFNTQMAGAFIVAVPTILIYILFGEQFAKGVNY
ncbi:MAG: carbohydrate ABC transporter permease [Halobacteriaceae archaeon]